MALTVTERPLGHKIIDDGTSFTIFNSGGDAGFTDSLSLSTGDYIYIDGYVENYNGFWYVDKSGGIVYLKSNANSDRVDFIVEANVTVFTTEDHGWNCAHLPIVYKIESDLFPNNSVDPIVSITPYGYVGNYFAVQHSALTGGNALFALDFVSMDDGSDTPFILQVVEVQSTTITVLNFDGTTPGGSLISIQKYRNNYHALVKVYAGLESGHPWASQKPYELAVTLKLIPDSNNEIMFSINEILKSYLNIRNNDLLGTLPNNIDFFTEFYITTQEAYDESDGTDITINYETEVVDSFEGYAANAMLEFKNVYSGYLSDYAITDGVTGIKFLTLFETPTIFSGKYFDISFIRNTDSVLSIKKISNYYEGQIEETESIINYGLGLYRVQVSQPCSGTFTTNIEQDTLITSYNFITDMDGWFNTVDGVNPSSSSPPIWAYSSDDGGSLKLTQSNTLSAALSLIRKSTISLPHQNSFIRIKWKINYPPNNSGLSLQFSILDSGNSFIQGPTILDSPTSSSLQTTDIQVTSSSVWLNADAFLIATYANTTPIDNLDVIHIDSIEIYSVSQVESTNEYTGLSSLSIQIFDDEDNELSELKNIDVNCACENNSIYLTWLNNLGGFDYWNFTDGSDYMRNVGETGETKKNIFPEWPKSYGKNADTIRKQTFRETNKGILVRSQALSLEELTAIEYIKSSILVEIVYARGDKRRVLVDTNSWVSYRDIDKLYTLSFTLNFTDDIPAQRL